MKKQKQPNLYEPKYCDLQTHKLFDFDNECKNTQRFDIVRYPFIDKLNDKMLSFFWRPDEISMGRDKVDYETNSEDYEKFIITEQLKKLTMLDSLQGRSPIFTFGQITTNPEFENCILTWDFFEGSIHSRSYSHIIQSMYPDPQEVFDSTFDNKILTKHTKTIIRDYNNFYPTVIKYLNGESIDKKEFKEQLILALVSVMLLEQLRFYSGFASFWSLTEFRNIFPGSSKILQLIARDEGLHTTLVQHVFNTLRKNDEEGFKDTIEKLTPKIYDMYFEASEEEFEWIDFLYQHGTPLGINQNIAKEYIKYLTNLRLRAIGLKSIYPGSTKNPITWINKWLNFGSSESALQEVEAVDYQTGGIIMEDVDYGEVMKNV